MVEIKKGKYKHYKGSIMQVIDIAKHSETLEDMVIYKHINPSDNKFGDVLWVRPAKMFLENVEINGKKVKRFEFIE